jgi:hypothetical protein
MAVVVKGLDRLVRELQGMPKKVQRAARNALNVALTESNRDIIAITHRELGLKKSLIRRQLKIDRPRFVSGQVVLSGEIKPSNRRIALREYKPKLRRVSATRAAVVVKDEIGKPARLSGSAFINPRHSRKDVMRRITKNGKLVPRSPVTAAAGPSMAVHIRAIVTPAYQRKRTSRFAELFNQKLDDQLKKTRR